MSKQVAVDTGSSLGKRVDVLGVGVSVTTIDHTVEQVESWLASGLSRYVCVRDVHGVMQSQGDAELLRIHDESGLAVPDGMPMVWAGRYAGAKEIEHVRGPDLMLAVCELAASRGWRSFFYGGGPGVAEMVAGAMRRRFPGFQVSGTFTPPFRPLTEREDADVVRLISESHSQLVWIGLSTPKQERWMASHVDRLNGPVVLFGVGAAFDIHAGLVKDSPRWTRRLGLQWVYRVVREPRRLWRRYLKVVPRFLILILRRRPFLRP